MYSKFNNTNEKSQLFLLHLHAKEIERLILKDFLKIFQHDYTTNDLFVIKNFHYEKIDNQNITSSSQTIYVSNNTLHIRSVNQYLILELSHIKRFCRIYFH